MLFPGYHGLASLANFVTQAFSRPVCHRVRRGYWCLSPSLGYVPERFVKQDRTRIANLYLKDTPNEPSCIFALLSDVAGDGYVLEKYAYRTVTDRRVNSLVWFGPGTKAPARAEPEADPSTTHGGDLVPFDSNKDVDAIAVTRVRGQSLVRPVSVPNIATVDVLSNTPAAFSDWNCTIPLAVTGKTAADCLALKRLEIDTIPVSDHSVPILPWLSMVMSIGPGDIQAYLMDMAATCIPCMALEAFRSAAKQPGGYGMGWMDGDYMDKFGRIWRFVRFAPVSSMGNNRWPDNQSYEWPNAPVAIDPTPGVEKRTFVAIVPALCCIGDEADEYRLTMPCIWSSVDTRNMRGKPVVQGVTGKFSIYTWSRRAESSLVLTG